MEYINMDKRFKISKILIRNLIFLLLFALLTTEAFSMGFDSASSCSPNAKQSRRGRAQMLATIPCDLTTHSYCSLPGAAYPWHAVRRFVHENQGLMKRMYGDVRHISVLRDEMLNNEIDIDDIELTAKRYSRDGYKHRASKLMHNRDEFDNFKLNDVLRDAYFRPVIASTDSASTTSTTKKPIPNQEPGGSTTTTTERIETTVVANDLENTTTPGTMTNLENTTMDIEDNTNNSDDTKTNPATELDANESTITSSNLLEKQQLTEENKMEENDSDDEEEDVHLEFNSIDAIAGEELSIPPNVMLGENIEIVESPQLGLINITLEYSTNSANQLNSEISSTTYASSTTTNTAEKPTSTSTTTKTTITTSTTSTTPKTETIAERSTAKQQRKPFVPSSSRYRPQQPAQKIDSTISAKLKLKVNPTQAASFTPTTITINYVNNTTTNDASLSSSTPSTPISSTKSSFPFKMNSNKNYNRYTTVNHNNRYGLHPPTPLPVSQPQTSSSQPFKGNADLLLGEKMRKPVAISTPATQAQNRPSMKEGQLFQDSMKQEPAPIVNAKGVNACPVKEEVVAPFWANNTRGEVLALLNLHPFEQYVHWEKCTQEHKQMYCREGCRCEQQYRLHRLLAYDPNNECRGIFSDWFRFPSCCICKCYNIPMDFRATSRSPRAEGGGDYRHPIEVAEERVKNAIYEHATEDWYRPKDEFDFYDG